MQFQVSRFERELKRFEIEKRCICENSRTGINRRTLQLQFMRISGNVGKIGLSPTHQCEIFDTNNSFFASFWICLLHRMELFV